MYKRQILFRYKSLLPLTILVFLIEWSARVINASNSPLNLAEYKTGTTPGIESAPYVTVFLLILFITRSEFFLISFKTFFGKSSSGKSIFASTCDKIFKSFSLRKIN